VIRDLAYVPGGHLRQKLDLYLPTTGKAPFPILVWIHGGAWQSGSKDNCPITQQALVRNGYALASINYRLSTDAPFPAQLQDCKSAVRWLRAHARHYRLDPDRIGVSGASAGGHLAALLGTTGTTREFDLGDYLDQSSQVQAVCDFFGPSDFVAFAALPGYVEQEDSPIVNLLGGTVRQKPELARKASPVNWVRPGTAPFLILHGDNDPLVPISQSQLLFNVLKSRGVPVQFHTIHGAGHGQGFGGPEIGLMVAGFFEQWLRQPTGAGAGTHRFKTSSSLARVGD
jgi:acetyl esterase/lipase